MPFSFFFFVLFCFCKCTRNFTNLKKISHGQKKKKFFFVVVVYNPPSKKQKVKNKSLPHRRRGKKKPHNRSTGKHYPSRKAKSFSVIQPRGEVQQKQVQFRKKLLISSEERKKNKGKKKTQETKTKYTFKSPAKFSHERVLNTSLF